MLSIGKMVARAEDYYLRTVANGREDYYTGSGESPGYWLGEGARRLGLDGEVDADDLRAVLAGFSPTGQVLSAGRVDPAHRVAGFDLTWSAPKSVSLLYGLSDPEISAVVRAVHSDAVAQALGYLERRALHLRRGAGGEHQVSARGLVAGAFMHRTSRSGDPQLHTHVLVANVAEGLDGVWSAPDARLLYFHARTAGFLYQAALRAGLTGALGVRFGPVVHGSAELEGVPLLLTRAFSTRRRQIEQQLARSGASSSRAAEAAALMTRDPKDRRLDVTDHADVGLVERWRARADELGFAEVARGSSLLEQLRQAAERSTPSSTDIAQLMGHLLGPDGLTAAQSAFERRDVVRLVAEQMAEGASVGVIEGVAEGVLERSEVVALPSVGRGGELRHTTRELLGVEAALLEAAWLGRDAGAGVVLEAARQDALSHFPLLASEQVEMVKRLTSSGHLVEAVVGKAGAGKTLALAAARKAWEAQGYRVLGAALSARAARGLRDGAAIASDTLARRLIDLDTGRESFTAGDVIVLDEAAMVGTRALARLLETTTKGGAKLVLVGDPRQLPEIEAGGAFAALIERVGAIELNVNRRQRERWERLALDALRLGRAPLALATYDRAGRVHIAPSMAAARAELVQAWLSSRGAGEESVMLAVTRRDVAALNHEARASLREAGALGPDLIEIDGVGFALGDRVVCLRNDRKLSVMNGSVGTVMASRGGGLVVETDEGKRVLPERYVAQGHLSHAYALTVHKSQGLTVERAFVLATESLTQEAGYVAMSRARQGSELFVPLGVVDTEMSHDPRPIVQPDPLEEVARRLMNSRAKQLASNDLGNGVLAVPGDSRLERDHRLLAQTRRPGNNVEPPSDDGEGGAMRIAARRGAEVSMASEEEPDELAGRSALRQRVHDGPLRAPAPGGLEPGRDHDHGRGLGR